MYRVPAIAVLLGAAALPPSLEGQMRAVQRPNVPAQISVEPHFRAMHPPGGFRVMVPRPLARRGSFVGAGAFPDHFRFNLFFGNSCFTNPFFDPFFCQSFFFPNRFLFAEPVFLPYPVTTAPYYAEQTGAPAPQVVVVQAAPTAAQEPQVVPESLLLEWRGDHWARVTSYGQSATGARPDYSRRSNQRAIPSGRMSATAQPRELPPAVLVFHDGRTEEVNSYVIVSDTMYTKADYWTSGSWTKKILLADLDLPATLRLNQERGVKLALPAGPHEVVMRP